MKALRQPYDAEVKEIAMYAVPARSRWLASDTNKGRKKNRDRMLNKRQNSSHSVFAFRTLQGGMTSGLSSQSRPWFTLGVQDEQLAEDPAVKAYLDECERRMYRFFALTNFYGAVKTGYLEMGAFGTDACVMLEHPVEGAVCHALTFGEYWLALNDALLPGALYRDCAMTALQAVETFGLNNVSDRVRRAYDRSDYEEFCQYYHAIEENPDYTPGVLGWRGKKWRSVYWDHNEGTSTDYEGGLTKLSGFEEQPFWAPRWDTTGGDIWGQGPGHDALPDMRELQLEVKRKGEAIDWAIHPELISAAKVPLKRQPRNVVNVPQIEDVSKVVHPTHTVDYQTIGIIREDVADIRQSINQATYADLFMAITNMQGIQPRNIEEIAARNEEKLTQLGPVIERVNNEKLEIAINRTFGIMQRAGMLPQPPESLHNVETKVNFISILTQMQRMVGLGQIERGLSFVGNVSALFPAARHKVNPMELVDEYWERAGAPMKILNSNDDAEAAAEAEANAQQMQQAAEAAAKLGKPIKDVTDAAKVAVDTPGSGIPPVQDLVPVVPR
jgi:hypothetical protein